MKISIITTTYNRKELLQETMRSIAAIVVAPLNIEWEHIIYDDASTDGTAEFFEGHPFPHTIFIGGKENKGPSYGRNRAIERSTGDWIFFIDSDDIILERTLCNFAKAVQKHPDTTWFIADFLRVNDQLSYQIGQDYYGWDFKDTQEMLEAIFKGEHFLQGNVFFKKSLFLKSDGFDESLRMAEDLDLYIRFLLAGEMPLFCSFTSHLHRFHVDNASTGITPEIHTQHLASLKKKYRI